MGYWLCRDWGCATLARLRGLPCFRVGWEAEALEVSVNYLEYIKKKLVRNVME